MYVYICIYIICIHLYLRHLYHTKIASESKCTCFLQYCNFLSMKLQKTHLLYVIVCVIYLKLFSLDSRGFFIKLYFQYIP